MSEHLAEASVPRWDLADRLRKALREAGVSVQEMAEYLEISRNTVGSWINGHHRPRPSDLKQWALSGPMTPNAVGHAATRALGDGWGAHTLRHRFATRAYAATHDLFAVQTLLGHSKPETTRRYTELADNALSDAVNAI